MGNINPFYECVCAKPQLLTVRLCVGFILKLNQLAACVCVCVCKWVEYQNLSLCGLFFVCFNFFLFLTIRPCHCYYSSSTAESRSMDSRMLHCVFLCLWWLCDSYWMEASSERQMKAGKHQPCPLSKPATPCYPPPTCLLHQDHRRTEKKCSLLQKTLLKFVWRTSWMRSVLKWN